MGDCCGRERPAVALPEEPAPGPAPEPAFAQRPALVPATSVQPSLLGLPPELFEEEREFFLQIARTYLWEVFVAWHNALRQRRLAYRM